MPEITPAERMIFDRERRRIETGPVLDIGIGAGRTTAVLAPLSSRYVGTDYSPAMVMHCRRHFRDEPRISFILSDAASMPMLESGVFQFVLFSFNGLDSVGHDHRLRVLREVRRLLADDGRFAFSAHNRSYAGTERVPRLRRPLRLRGLARTGLEMANHLRARRRAFACDEYELINDPPHLFSLVTYYIDRRAQIAQLEREGFRVLAVVDTSGAIVTDGDDETLSPNFYYLAERAA